MSTLTQDQELRQALADIDNFIVEVVQLRNNFDGRVQEFGMHWPEYVWSDLFGAAMAGIGLLRQHVGAG